VVAAAIAVRALLFRDVPAVLTNDSWDYLNAAVDIRRALDFFTPALRDVRLPGYPTLLALAHPLIGLRSDGIVLLQTALGLANVAIGWTIGRLAGSRLLSVGLATFFGLDPVYLLFEHAVMSEGFSLTLYGTVLAVALAARRPGAGWPSSACLGIVLGLAILTRANVLVFGAVLAAGVGVSRAQARAFGPRGLLVAAGWTLVPLTIAAVVVAPWIWRNRVAYGHVSLYGSANSNVLVYKDMHAPLDGSAPTLADVNRRLGRELVDFIWQQELQREFGSSGAENVARVIMLEQIAAHPWQHLLDIVQSAAGFVGFNATYGNERSALRYWFRGRVGDIATMNRLARDSPGAAVTPGWIYDPRPRDRWTTRTFARVGDLALFPGRAIGFVCLAWLLLRYARRGWAQRTHRGVVALLATGYLGTLAMHAVMLTDYDRYGSIFDFLAVAIAALVVDDMRSARAVVTAGRAEGATRPSRSGALARPGEF
jgi:hypothetical protein